MTFMRTIWAKAAAVAVAGGTVFALFGGSAVHTQFSATAGGTATASGAHVALSVNANQNAGGDFSCSQLVPGATPSSPWPTEADNGYCSITLTLTNNGNANEVLSIAYSSPDASQTTSGIDNSTDLGYLYFSYDYPTQAGPFPYYTNGSPTGLYSFGTFTPGESKNVTLTITLAGLAGNEWDNATVSIPYTVTATAGSTGGLLDNIAYYTINDGTTFTRYSTPQSGVAAGGGTDSQATAGVGGPVSLSIEGSTSYTDNGFYIVLGKLGSFTGYTIQGTGDAFGDNLWFDLDNDGSFFVWSGNTFSGVGGDTYAAGPGSSGGTVSVGQSTTFSPLNGSYTCGSDTLAQLQAGACSIINKDTLVALWVGDTASNGGSLSTTITSVQLTH